MANLTFDFLHNYVTGERRASDPADAYQYDEGHVLEAVVPVAVTSCEIQYWIRGMEKADAYTPTSITQNTDNTYTILGNIPNSYFETNGDLRVYIVVTDGDASITTYEGYIHIKERQMPEDYVDDDPDNDAVQIITAARGYAETSEAWAVGQINGEDVPSTADQYQNNASYYAGQAASAASSAAAQASLAPAYDNTATYAVGDYCLHDGQLYECTTAITTAEAWTAAHWTAVTVGSELSDLKDDFDELGVRHFNRFNKNTVIANHYVNAEAGEILPLNDFNASDWIDISDLATVKISNVFIACWYDQTKTFISSYVPNPSTALYTLTVPSSGAYMRVTVANASLSTAQVGENVSRENYISYGKYTLDDYIPNDNTIIVDASGNGDYTSLTEALYQNVDSVTDIIVKPGTYDLHAEYIAKWGASAVDSIADADASTFNGFQFGAIVRNKKMIFESGSYVVCDYTYQSDGTTAQIVNGTHRICAFRVDFNAEIIGLNLTVKHVFYAIHDDYGLLDTPYTNKYENCRIVGSDITNANCIGGGCKKFSRHILNNCYFDNGSTWQVSARYHNTLYSGAVPEVYVSNCYFNNGFEVTWYGAQTTKMKAYVNNCHAKYIRKAVEAVSEYDNDNVDLYKWCNEETGV